MVYMLPNEDGSFDEKEHANYWKKALQGLGGGKAPERPGSKKAKKKPTKRRRPN